MKTQKEVERMIYIIERMAKRQEIDKQKAKIQLKTLWWVLDEGQDEIETT